MTINLSKGQRIDLTKTNPGLTKVIIGLGWDTNQYDGGHDFDLDASAFLTDENGKVTQDLDFIFYNNLKHSTGCVEHTGDNRTGEGDGDDEQIKINFSKVPSHVHRIAITVTIHDADVRNQNFGQVSNAFVRVVNEDTNQEVLRYDLGEDFSVETAVVICELYRHGSEWKFSAIGSGFQGGLAALCRNFGLQV
ncbi:TerD family protein [Bacillus aquiflavi]|uniref:TerD family protein n=1 Tax=Bacillus aquiflavi TaxID=2672567 RepID=A0A6B3W2A7_9BACI|nr:TerD family protein [Bacillus aquiflavi]MBA4537780.1 TerD family protein [Bacillus aquiflavi]NEY82036.1 TerD family protein [Bacillus aquiflavi]